MQLRKKFTQLVKNIFATTSTLHIFCDSRTFQRLHECFQFICDNGKEGGSSHFNLEFMHSSLNNGKKCEYHLNYSGIAI